MDSFCFYLKSTNSTQVYIINQANCFPYMGLLGVFNAVVSLPS